MLSASHLPVILQLQQFYNTAIYPFNHFTTQFRITMHLLNKKNLIFFFSSLLMASMIYSPYLLSVSMFALAALCLVDIRFDDEGLVVEPDRAALARLRHFWRYPAFMAFGLFFLVVLLSFWQTYDYDYWLARLRIKLPFLGLPLVFIALPRFTERQVHGLLYILLLILLLTSVGIGVNYLLNYEAIQANIKQGQPIPTPRNHIRFSLLLAYGILCGWSLYDRRFRWRYDWEPALILALTVFLFLFMHFLSVRTGLVALYTGILVMLARYIYLSRNYRLAAGALAVMILLPTISYHAIPSFQAKVNYMRWDWKMYREGKGEEYADSGRLTSLKVGYDLFREHPAFGVGAGNLRAETERIFKAKYPAFKEPLTPHNQFLFVLAGSGLAGLSLFLFAFFFPLFHRRHYQNLPLLGFYGIAFTSFMLEHTIENSIGAAFFCFFVLLWLNRLREEA